MKKRSIVIVAVALFLFTRDFFAIGETLVEDFCINLLLNEEDATTTNGNRNNTKRGDYLWLLETVLRENGRTVAYDDNDDDNCQFKWYFQKPVDDDETEEALFGKRLARKRVNYVRGVDCLTSKEELVQLGLRFVPATVAVDVVSDEESLSDSAYVTSIDDDSEQRRYVRKKNTHGGVEVLLLGDKKLKEGGSSSDFMYQKFIENAMKIDGMAFDYGVYVFLSETKDEELSYQVWDDVMLRFATNGMFVESKYTNAWNVTSLQSVFTVDEEKKVDNELFEAKTAFAKYLGDEKSKIVFDLIDEEIKDSFEAARPYLWNRGGERASAFSILRFDFVIDENLFPWLIEVNQSPNMKPSSLGQQAMLRKMLDHVAKKYLFAPDEDIGLKHVIVRDSVINRKQTRTLAQSEPPSDVDCILSEWTAYSPTECANPCTMTSLTQFRSRSIQTGRRGNGKQCDTPLIQSQNISCPNPCANPPPPSPPPSPPPPVPPPPPNFQFVNPQGETIIFGSNSSNNSTSSRVGELTKGSIKIQCVLIVLLLTFF